MRKTARTPAREPASTSQRGQPSDNVGQTRPTGGQPTSPDASPGALPGALPAEAPAVRPLATVSVSEIGHAPQALPDRFADWFQSRGWSPRPHQMALLALANTRRSSLLIAPTGAGKTLAGFLPSLTDLAQSLSDNAGREQTRHDQSGAGLHTLYISPLKALSVDIARNLSAPIEEMGLPVRVETRSGDTSSAKRQRQRRTPPDILLTTPEQLALLTSHTDSAYLFADVKFVILDELHSLVASKRGDLLALGLARLRRLAPDLTVTGLSATVARPSELRAFLQPQTEPDTTVQMSALVQLNGGTQPDITILEGDDPLPWSGHSARYAMAKVLEAISRHKLSLIFVNTRSQAEFVFQQLWSLNDRALPIALHHGSLDAGQRRKVEQAMSQGRLKAVVATSTLDLGIDWGDVDLVIHIGAPKGASRLTQRIGRSNHRLDEPSKALLVPSNRFEVLECRAALDATLAGVQDAVLNRQGALDVLAQHVMSMACSGALHREALYDEVRSCAGYAHLTRDTFNRVVDFVATGGYALRAYDRFARLKSNPDGSLRVAHPKLAHQHRLNIGTIVQSPMMTVRLVRPGARKSTGAARGAIGGKVLGELDEWFAGELTPGDTFLFAGEILQFEGSHETDVLVSRTRADNATVPSYPGGKFPLSTHLAERVRQMVADRAYWSELPTPVCEWLKLQDDRSVMPSPDEVLVETFPRTGRHYLVAYPFEGRLAHQTLGMLLTRRLQRARLQPLGFVANDYGLSIWCGKDLSAAIDTRVLTLQSLFNEDMLGDDLEAWLVDTTLMKRTFRSCATIAGLVDRRHPGQEKTGRQMTVSADLIYDVLRRHDPHHILLEATWQDAASGLLDIKRLGDFLGRIKGRIQHRALARVSPLSVPILLEIGREPVRGGGVDDMLRDVADELIREAISNDKDVLSTPH